MEPESNSLPWTDDQNSSVVRDRNGNVVFCGHDVGECEFVVHACNAHPKLKEDISDLLEFIKDLLAREDRTLADDGVLLCDEVRSEGLRLLKSAGWTTVREDDEFASWEPEDQ